MTRNALVSALIDRAQALVGNGNGNDEISPEEAAEAISDAIAETTEVNARATAVAALNSNGEEDEGDTDDAPEDKRQKFEPIDFDAEATFGQKRLLQGLATYDDGEPLRMLYPAGSAERAIVDGKWTAGLAYAAIDAMLHYTTWQHPEGYILVPDSDAVLKFRNSQA